MRVKPYDVDPLVRPHGEQFWQVNPVRFFGTDGDSWLVEPGLTDFASVPRIAVWLIPKFGKWTAAALLHDWFCRFAIAAGIISPRQADGVFRSVMRRDGVPPLLRNLAWAGVRWGAVLNPIRRHEWWSDFPRLLAVSAVGLLLLPLATLGITVGLALYWPAEWLASLLFDKESASSAGTST